MGKPTVRKATEADKVLVEGGLGAPELARLRRYQACTQLSLRALTAPDLACVALFPALASVELYGTRIDDWGALAGCRTLRHLFVNGVKDPERLTQVSALPQLARLGLANLPTVTALPDLARCRRLTEVLVWNCKRLRDLTPLLRAPRLQQVRLVSTPHAPDELIPLLALPRVKYVAAQFGTIKANQRFATLLAEHGKRAYPAA